MAILMVGLVTNWLLLMRRGQEVLSHAVASTKVRNKQKVCERIEPPLSVPKESHTFFCAR
jgi:hypothetical protein